MPGGLQVWGDGGQVQIDGSTPHLTLLRKGSTQSGSSLSFPGAPQGPINVATANITVNPGEILAYRPQPGVWATVYGRSGSTTYVFTSSSFATIEFWIFSQHQPSGLNYGMQVFDPNQNMIYDTGRPIMNVLGTHDGTGGPTGWPQNNVAVIPWQTYASVKRDIIYTSVGVNIPHMLFLFATAGCVQVSGNQVWTENRVITHNATGPFNPPSQPPSNWVYEGNNGIDNRLVVVGLDNIP